MNRYIKTFCDILKITGPTQHKTYSSLAIVKAEVLEELDRRIEELLDAKKRIKKLRSRDV